MVAEQARSSQPLQIARGPRGKTRDSFLNLLHDEESLEFVGLGGQQ
jgi:hypothetical protein